MIPDIAVGAIVAALVGAMISLVGLIVSKESKVSDFRQAWIDKLREELSSFATNLNALADAHHIDFKDKMERFEKLSESTRRLNEAYYSIALRLNVTEELASAVRSSMVKLASMVTSAEALDVEMFNNERVAFINAANILLKDEWKRVKAGERVYRATRLIAASLLGLLMLAVVVIAAAGIAKMKVGERAGGAAVRPISSTSTLPSAEPSGNGNSSRNINHPVKGALPSRSGAPNPVSTKDVHSVSNEAANP